MHFIVFTRELYTIQLYVDPPFSFPSSQHRHVAREAKKTLRHATEVRWRFSHSVAESSMLHVQHAAQEQGKEEDDPFLPRNIHNYLQGWLRVSHQMFPLLMTHPYLYNTPEASRARVTQNQHPAGNYPQQKEQKNSPLYLLPPG